MIPLRSTMIPQRQRYLIPALLMLVVCMTQKASAQEANHWLRLSIVDESPLFRHTSYVQNDVPDSAESNAASEMTPDTQDLLGQLTAVSSLPKQEQVGFQAPVTTLTLTPSTVGDTPAAIFVIDQEMIRRSGAQTIPDLLRMVPGVHVGMTNGRGANVSIRGFGFGGSSSFSPRVLVLIDGRSIYEPVFGGVIWITNDLVLQDIERIEVIRGPGATIWGANAVNGVINIITKSAADTQGTLLSSLGGSEYHNISVARHGMEIDKDTHLRVYGKFRDIDEQYRDPRDANLSIPFNGVGANDGYHDFQGGFRLDKKVGFGDLLSVQGRIAALPSGTIPYQPGSDSILAGPNPGNYFVGDVQALYTHRFLDDSELTFLGIYDRADTGDSYGQYHRDSYILDAAYKWSWGPRHKLLAGGQIRIDRDTVVPLEYRFYTIGLDPASRTYSLPSWLIQDEIALVPDDLTFLVGAKMEVNPFTGFEIQPSGRLLKKVDDQRAVWCAVSRAVRRPNRIDENIFTTFQLPAQPAVVGSPKLQADSLIAAELGYRAEPTEWLSWDLSTFMNFYNDLPAPDVNLVDKTVSQINLGSATSYGAELNGTVKLTQSWSITGNYSYLAAFSNVDVPGPKIIGELTELLYEGSSPRNLSYIRSSWDLGEDWDIDLIGRYSDYVAFAQIPSYYEIDIRLAWRPREHLEVAVVGQNLLDAAHPEQGTLDVSPFSPIRTQVQRSIYGSITYSY